MTPSAPLGTGVLSIVIVGFNAGADLQACLLSLKKGPPAGDYEITELVQRCAPAQRTLTALPGGQHENGQHGEEVA